MAADFKLIKKIWKGCVLPGNRGFNNFHKYLNASLTSFPTGMPHLNTSHLVCALPFRGLGCVERKCCMLILLYRWLHSCFHFFNKKCSLLYIPGIIAFCLTVTPLTGQKSLTMANQAFDMMHYHEALGLYDDWFAQSNDSTALEKKAACYLKTGQYKQALKTMSQCQKRIHKNDKLLLKYGELLLMHGDRDSSMAVLQLYINTYGQNAASEKLSASIAMALQSVNAEIMHSITEATFNSGEGDYCPGFYDGRIIFTSHRKGKPDPWTGKPFAGLYISDKNEKNVYPVHIEMAIDYHIGAAVFSDPQTMYFTTNGQVKGRFEDYNLHIAVAGKTKDGIWVHSGIFPYSTPEYSLAYPTLSPDGNTIIFCSDKPGGKGGFDLYMSTKKDGKWDVPVHMSEISTAGDDMFPYLDSTQQIYFASDGLPGLGGLDIYSIPLKEYKEKSVQHLDAPFNSPADDFGLITGDKLNTGYLSSNRKGVDKIYKFNKKNNPE